jgi:hypothetical protein
MDKRKNEKHLDELISRAINTEEPQFDAEEWKQKYPKEYQALISRAAAKAPTGRPNIWRIALRNPIIKLAAAAVIIIAITFFSIRQDQDRQEGPGIGKATRTPAEMMTAMSLTIAYRKGGMEAVEEQYDKAYKQLGPRPKSLSVEQILSEFNGT